jgi:hypothetical protein
LSYWALLRTALPRSKADAKDALILVELRAARIDSPLI